MHVVKGIPTHLSPEATRLTIGNPSIFLVGERRFEFLMIGFHVSLVMIYPDSGDIDVVDTLNHSRQGKSIQDGHVAPNAFFLPRGKELYKGLIARVLNSCLHSCKLLNYRINIFSFGSKWSHRNCGALVLLLKSSRSTIVMGSSRTIDVSNLGIANQILWNFGLAFRGGILWCGCFFRFLWRCRFG